MNKQLYENSGLAALFDDQEGAVVKESQRPGVLGAFFNQREPNLAILHEKPEHRLLLYMKAQGLSNRRIAEESGYTEAWMSQLFRQPWAQARLLEILNETGVSEVTGLLRSAAADSVVTLIRLRDDEGINPSVRRASADSLLDRYLGKATQPIADVTDKDKLKEMSDADLERIAASGRTAN